MSATVCSRHLLQPLGYVDSWLGGGGVSADGPQGDEGGGDGDDEHQAAHEHLHQVYILLAPGVVSEGKYMKTKFTLILARTYGRTF